MKKTIHRYKCFSSLDVCFGKLVNKVCNNIFWIICDDLCGFCNYGMKKFVFMNNIYLGQRLVVNNIFKQHINFKTA